MENLILVVDDAKFARVVTKKALQNGGYDNIIEATTAAEAMRMFTEQKPNLVLLDITLPDNSDLTLLKNMLASDPQAKIVICSAIGQQLIIMDALKAGAKDFIIKPFEEKEFVQIVTKVLND